MAYFPNLTNFEQYVQTELDKRIGKIDYVSEKNCWFKIGSAVNVNYQGTEFKGLVMESNPDDLWNFAENEKSAYGRRGAESQEFLSGQALSGTIGYQLGNRGARVQVAGRHYRPRPSIDSFSIKNGTRGLSRQAEFQIKCYSLDQLEVISKFFLEPGNIVFMEWGWNTNSSASQSILRQNNKTKVIEDIIAQFNYNNLEKRREQSDGAYDNFVAFITGGDIQSSGDSYIVSVKLTSIGELAAYLKTQKGVNDEDDTAGSNNDLNFNESEIEDDDDLGTKQFRIMYNELPSHLKTNSVKALLAELGTEQNLVNFDQKDRNDLISFSGVKNKFKELLFAGLSTAASATNLTPTSAEFAEESILYSADNLISSNRYIRLGVLMKIISTASRELSVKIGDINVSNLYIDIENTKLIAFDKIYSTNKDILYIPNKNLPDFGLRQLLRRVNQSSVEPNTDINDLILNSQVSVNASLGSVQFPEDNANDDGLRWGYLKNLFVEFDYAMGIIKETNLSQTDWLYKLLNGISSAANDIWDFEIIERVNENGVSVPESDVTTPQSVGQSFLGAAENTTQPVFRQNIKSGIFTVQVIDMNYSENRDENEPYSFYNIGEQSIFLEGSFNMDIPGAMMNQIVAKRSSENLDVNPEGHKLVDGLFTKGIETDDLRIRYTEELSKDNETTKSPTKTEDSVDVKTKFLSFTGKMGIFPKQEGQTNGSTEDEENSVIKEVIAVTYDNNILFRKLYNKEFGEEEDVSVLLPIKFSFKIHGISGIKVGDKFKVKDLPDKYSKGGFFQVTDVSHDLSGMLWTTSVEGQFRRNR